MNTIAVSHTAIHPAFAPTPTLRAEGREAMDATQIAMQAEQAAGALTVEDGWWSKRPRLRAPLQGTAPVAELLNKGGLIVKQMASILGAGGNKGEAAARLDIDALDAQSAERHFGAPGAEGEEGAAWGPLLVADRYSGVMLALSEANRMASVLAGKASVMLTTMSLASAQAAAEKGRAAARSSLAAAISAAVVSTAIGAHGTRQIVGAQMKNVRSTTQNSMQAVRTDTRVKAASLAQRGAASIPSRQGFEVTTNSGKKVAVPSDADGATDAMKAVARSDVRESEAAMARASHDYVQARSQMDHVRGMFTQSYAQAAGNAVEKGVEVKAADERVDKELLNQSQQAQVEMAAKQTDQANRMRQLYDALLQVLASLNAQMASTSGAILANTRLA